MLQVPAILRLFYKDAVWRLNPNEKVIYLTFDDGPNPVVTPQVLSLLEDYGVKATFFCIGDNVRKYPELFDELSIKGHAIGNHTFNHLRGFDTPTNEYVENVLKADSLIGSRLFRPPHGRIKLGQYRILKKEFKVIMWDVISYDYNKKISPETIMREIRLKSRNGSIVVFHDSLKAEKNVLAVLPQALKFWHDAGYELRTITEDVIGANAGKHL